MDKRQIIKRLLEISQSPTSNLLNPNGALGWMGQTSGVQQQVNEAIDAWLNDGDSHPLIGAVGTLVIMGSMTDEEARKIQDCIIAVS